MNLKLRHIKLVCKHKVLFFENNSNNTNKLNFSYFLSISNIIKRKLLKCEFIDHEKTVLI